MHSLIRKNVGVTPQCYNSIIQGASTIPRGQFATRMTEATSCNKPWRNLGTNTVQQHTLQPHTTTLTDRRTCRKLRNNVPSPRNSHISTGYHPTATPPPLNAPNSAVHATRNPQPSSMTDNRLQNYQDTNQPWTSTTVHTRPITICHQHPLQT